MADEEIWKAMHEKATQKPLERMQNMSLLDWFAGQALTGVQQWDAILNGRNTNFQGPGGAAKIAEVAYAVAEAMLAEHERRNAK